MSIIYGKTITFILLLIWFFLVSIEYSQEGIRFVRSNPWPDNDAIYHSCHSQLFAEVHAYFLLKYTFRNSSKFPRVWSWILILSQITKNYIFTSYFQRFKFSFVSHNSVLFVFISLTFHFVSARGYTCSQVGLAIPCFNATKIDGNKNSVYKGRVYQPFLEGLRQSSIRKFKLVAIHPVHLFPPPFVRHEHFLLGENCSSKGSISWERASMIIGGSLCVFLFFAVQRVLLRGNFKQKRGSTLGAYFRIVRVASTMKLCRDSARLSVSCPAIALFPFVWIDIGFSKNLNVRSRREN